MKKQIYLNLKRFDIPKERFGVNSIAPPAEWSSFIVKNTQDALKPYRDTTDFTMFFPEAHLIGAVSALNEGSLIHVGCQGVFRDDTAEKGNFGAFTTNRTANAAAALGCTDVIIGHCEERRDKLGILQEAGVADVSAVNRILNKEVLCARAAGLKVLYCVGETTEEQPHWEETLGRQLDEGLAGIPVGEVAIAYEPVWAIGPGKVPPGKEYIEMIAKFIKKKTNGAPVVYGGGLKTDNAGMLASIAEIDGGLIALTRFTGVIGFYPEEYLEIIKTYMGF